MRPVEVTMPLIPLESPSSDVCSCRDPTAHGGATGGRITWPTDDSLRSQRVLTRYLLTSAITIRVTKTWPSVVAVVDHIPAIDA